MPNNRKNSVKSLINYAKKVGKSTAKFEQKTFADSGQKKIQKKEIQSMVHELAAKQFKLEAYIDRLEQQSPVAKNVSAKADPSEQLRQKDELIAQLKRENAGLKANLQRKDQEIAKLKADLQQIFDEYGNLSKKWRENSQRKFQFIGVQAVLRLIRPQDAESGNVDRSIEKLTLDSWRQLRKPANSDTGQKETELNEPNDDEVPFF